MAVSGADSTLNQIIGNRIGTNGLGTAELHNDGNGVTVKDAGATIIGGTQSAGLNLISGNNGNGVNISGQATLTQVIGNFIGTDVTGTGAIGNAYGVRVSASGNNIGSGQNGQGNVISGNRNSGVRVSAADNVLVKGNLIGTNKLGNAPVPNLGNGVEIGNSINVQVGGSTALERNVISGNGVPGGGNTNLGNGVLIVQGSYDFVVGNYIGTDATGNNAIANQTDGVSVNSVVNGAYHVVGDSGQGEGNIISGNAGYGIFVGDTTRIKNNTIGKKANGQALPNQKGGITDPSNYSTMLQNDVENNGGYDIEISAGIGHQMSQNTVGTLTVDGGSVLVTGGSNVVLAFLESAGSAALDVGASMTVADNATVSGGTLVLTNSTLSATNGVEIDVGGDLSGYGSIVATLNNYGTIDVGGPNHIGTLSITGDYNNYSTGVVNMEASASGVNDQLQVSGSVYLTGTLNFSLLGSYHPVSGDHFSLLTFGGNMTIGGFTVNYPPLDPGLGWWVTNSPPGTLTLTVVPHP